MMVSIGKGPWERRCGMKGRDEEKSTTQEENCNIMCQDLCMDRFTSEWNEHG